MKRKHQIILIAHAFLMVALTACGTDIGPSIIDHPVSLEYGTIDVTRGMPVSVTPQTRASAHAGIASTSAFRLNSPSLPAGLSYNADTGIISGTPTTIQVPTSYQAFLMDTRRNSCTNDFDIIIRDLWNDGHNAVAGFPQGAMTSTLQDPTTKVLRLITAANQSSLDPSWTPQWNSLKGYYKMDNDWQDSSGNLNHGSPAVGTPTFDSVSKVGPASGSFNGSSYVSVPNSASLTFTSQMTVMTWIYISSSTVNFWLFSKNPPGFGSGFGIAFEHPTGRVWPHLGIGGGLHNPKSIGATAYNQWNHVVVTYDGAFIRTYLNGVLDSTTPQTGAIDTNTGPLWIGNAPGSPTEFLTGKIDELAIWDKALLGPEILEIYNRQLPAFSGSFESRVFDNLTPRSWPGIKWAPTLPYGKELTGDADQSGTITASDSETSQKYSAMLPNLMQDLVGLWHFNESTAGGGGAGNDYQDFSGQDLWLNGNGLTAFGGTGRFGSAVQLDGSSAYASASDADLPDLASARTVSVWVNPQALPTAGSSATILSWGTPTTAHQAYGISVHNIAGAMNVNHFSNSDDQQFPAAVPLYVWTHIVTSFDGTDARIYVNGKPIFTQAHASWNTVLGGTLAIGKNIAGTEYFNGLIDEVAIWKRKLSDDEVLGLYRRGGNRLRFQVHSCNEATCTVGPPAWVGPDGTANTYFSELYNSTGNLLNSRPSTGSPSMDFTQFGAPLPAALPQSRFFQYRLLMESDDANNLCNYSGAPTGCSPELDSVSTGPDF